jgi:hypothetical protein
MFSHFQFKFLVLHEDVIIILNILLDLQLEFLTTWKYCILLFSPCLSPYLHNSW